MQGHHYGLIAIAVLVGLILAAWFPQPGQFVKGLIPGQ